MFGGYDMFHDFEEINIEDKEQGMFLPYTDMSFIIKYSEMWDKFLLKLYRKRCSKEENIMIDSLLLEGCSVTNIIAVINDSTVNNDFKDEVINYRRFQETIASTFMDMILMDVDIADPSEIYYDLIENTSIKGIVKEDEEEVVKMDLNYKKPLRKLRKVVKGDIYE